MPNSWQIKNAHDLIIKSWAFKKKYPEPIHNLLNIIQPKEYKLLIISIL
jgi:hypothetical protein